MANNFLFAQLQPYSLNGSGAVTGDTTVVLKTMKDIDGNALTMSTAFGTKGFGTLEPGSGTNEEQISFTGLTNNTNGTTTLTGVKSVTFISPYTETSGLSKTHAGSTVFIISNTSGFYNELLSKDDDATINGVYTFTQSPIVPDPSTALQAANKEYVDGVVVAGGVDASTTVKGISRLSVSPNVTLGNPTITIASPAVVTLASHGLTVNDTVQFTTTGALPTGITASVNYYVISAGLAANTFEISTALGGSAVNTSGSQSGTHTLIKTTPKAVGDNDPRVPTQSENDALVGNNTDIAVGSGNKFVTQTGLQHNAETFAVDGSASSTAYTATLSPVPTSLTNGMTVRVKVGLANTTTTPTLNVNALGAKTIIKGVSTALAVGDIAASMYCTFVYDSTNTVWVLQNPVISASANTFYNLFKNGDTTKDASDASGTQTIAHGLGVIPKKATITLVCARNGGAPSGLTFLSRATYNGTTQSSQSTFTDGTGGFAVNTLSININPASTGSTDGVITFDATNIYIAWTKNNSVASGIYQLVWEAEA